ncbi:MAG: hypothetical protein BMS9Abin34_281 [Patescibacteria group bacterium]|nr:MAG: hypothetical protein BMS9Abin34_281 [Patescibacteria group bacterium]
MKRLVLIDTANFLHRAFYAFPMNLTTSDGHVINAVYGFVSMLLALTKELAPTHLVAALESEKEVVFREIEFPEYKATRVPKSPEEQAAYESQFPLLLKFFEVAKIRVLQAEGYEADDVIGTVAKKAIRNKQQATEVTIASNDRDLMQLISGNVKFYLPAMGKRPPKLYGKKEFREEFGFDPAQLVEYKALRGDPSDNIPGVRGIGDKTARELVQKYGTLENIYQHILEIRPSVAQKLSDGKDKADLSRRLATIVTDLPLKVRFKEMSFSGLEQPEVLELLRGWGFKSLLVKLGVSQEESKEEKSQLELL